MHKLNGYGVSVWLPEWYSTEEGLQPSNSDNRRLKQESDYSVLEHLHGPSQNSRMIRATITPKDDKFPMILVIRAGGNKFFLRTIDNEPVDIDGLQGRWSDEFVAQTHYDKIIRSTLQDA